MAEIYAKRAPGDFAGSKCGVDTCNFFARFTCTPYNEAGPRIGVCGSHIPVIIKGMMLTHGKAVVIQEVPGNWGHNEKAVINGKMHTVLAGSGNGK